jgi:hypothetical protein
MTPNPNQGTGDRCPPTGNSASDKIWTIESVRERGTTTDVEAAAAILGIGCTKAYELAKAGEFPVKTVVHGLAGRWAACCSTDDWWVACVAVDTRPEERKVAVRPLCPPRMTRQTAWSLPVSGIMPTG